METSDGPTDHDFRFPQEKGPREFGPLVSMFVFLPLLALAAVVSIPFVPVVAWWEKRKRRLLADCMRKQNRILEWPDFKRVLETSRGTLIVEGDPRKGPILWWTTEDIPTLSPHPCSRDISALFDRSYRPFRTWCYQRYTNPITGSALLVTEGGPERRGVAIGTDEDERGEGIFRDVPTVLTTYRGRR